MIDLIMTYCLAGQPCVNETVANFPQFDVGQKICEMAKPAIASGVRARAPSDAHITFKCQDGEEFKYEQPNNDLMNQLPGLINQFKGYNR